MSNGEWLNKLRERGFKPHGVVGKMLDGLEVAVHAVRLDDWDGWVARADRLGVTATAPTIDAVIDGIRWADENGERQRLVFSAEARRNAEFRDCAEALVDHLEDLDAEAVRSLAEKGIVVNRDATYRLVYDDDAGRRGPLPAALPHKLPYNWFCEATLKMWLGAAVHRASQLYGPGIQEHYNEHCVPILSEVDDLLGRVKDPENKEWIRKNFAMLHEKVRDIIRMVDDGEPEPEIAWDTLIPMAAHMKCVVEHCIQQEGDG